MATIRITKELRGDINRKIDADFRPVVEKHDTSFKINVTPEDMFEYALTYYLKTVGVSRSTFDALPQAWKESTKTIEVRFINGVEVPYGLRSFTMKKDMWAPDAMNIRGYQTVEADELEPVAAALTAHKDESARIVTEHNTFKNGVSRIMDASTTVKQAVEMWPQFIEVLPDNIKKRHFEVEVRQKKAKAEVDADLTDALSATLVSTKISKAV